MMGRVYSVDPGLGGTGWAEWTQRRNPERVGILTNRRPGELADRCHTFGYELKKIIKRGGGLDRAVHVWIEMPQQMTSIAGHAAQKGSIYSLTFLVGYLACSVWPCQVQLVQPVQWKGQLPKQIVAERAARIIGAERCRELDIKSHAWDAVGIGLWANGVW